MGQTKTNPTKAELKQKNPVRGEVYWANLEPVVGSEQGNSRPVLIVSNNIMNEKATIVLIVPMTRANEKAKAGPFNIQYDPCILEIDELGVKNLLEKGHKYAPSGGVILCNQARAVSKDRIIGRVGYFKEKHILKQVEQALIDSFALDACDDCAIPLRPKGLTCPNCGKAHRVKCFTCGSVFDISFRHCPQCGRCLIK